MRGLSAPGAQVEVRAERIASQEIDASAEINASPIASAQADERGHFNIVVHFAGKRSKRAPVGLDGDLWRIEVTASEAEASAAKVNFVVKRSNAGKWYRYYNRMRARRDKAKLKYRFFNKSKLTSNTKALLNKSGQIKGVVKEITRGSTPEEQRILVYTCKVDDYCPVWVKDSQAFWVKEGQSVYIFSVFKGIKTYDAQEGPITAPELEARLTTP